MTSEPLNRAPSGSGWRCRPTGVVAFLAGPEPNVFTGSTLAVDGGHSAGTVRLATDSYDEV